MRARATTVVALAIGIVATATSCRKQGESANADSTFVRAMIDLRVVTANTAQEVSDLLSAAGLHGFFQALCELAWKFATTLLQSETALDVCLMSQDGGVLGQYP